MKRHLRFSQNFITSPALVESLLAKTNITNKDTVYDIGAGRGILTAALASKCRTAVAVEADPKLVDILRKNFQKDSNILVLEGDFIRLSLPRTPYKVFANIPFNASADILHKLLDDDFPPVSSYLIVQKEFAQKLITSEGKRNHQLAVLLGVRYEFRILEIIDASNFYPVPNITGVLLEVQLRHKPLLPQDEIPKFRDFVVYTYNAFKPSVAEALSGIFNKHEFELIAKEINVPVASSPSQLTLNKWLRLFQLGSSRNQKLEQLVQNAESEYYKKHASRTKLHRTH